VVVVFQSCDSMCSGCLSGWDVEKERLKHGRREEVLAKPFSVRKLGSGSSLSWI